ncbi:MAG: hypothetical protein GY862_30745 [Gammaproteobacteria bacterium]|nr:hypothetical protein [Gammaproteobacteria bacterium]
MLNIEYRISNIEYRISNIECRRECSDRHDSSRRLTAIKLSGKTRCRWSVERSLTTAQCFSRRGTESEMPMNRGHPSAPQKPAVLAKLRLALQNMQHALNLMAVSRRLENFDIHNSQCLFHPWYSSLRRSMIPAFAREM